jgi:hypothetical protein
MKMSEAASADDPVEGASRRRGRSGAANGRPCSSRPRRMAYKGFPHGAFTIHADIINPDLLAFIRA